jgi:hypothetical protein
MICLHPRRRLRFDSAAAVVDHEVRGTRRARAAPSSRTRGEQLAPGLDPAAPGEVVHDAHVGEAEPVGLDHASLLCSSRETGLGCLQVGVQDPHQHGRLDALAERGEADQVGEEHRDVALRGGGGAAVDQPLDHPRGREAPERLLEVLELGGGAFEARPGSFLSLAR